MRKIIRYLIWFLLIPVLIWIGVSLYNDQQYDIISLLIAAFTCLAFYFKYENRKPNSQELVLVAALTAFSVVSRILFAFIPGFKPVAAIIIIVGMIFGKDMGFLVGSLTALLSNIYFSQGAHTPFQMFSWGMIGFFAGILNRPLKNFLLMLFYGALSAVIFSLIMDFQTMLFNDNAINLRRYLAYVAASSTFLTVYVISNVIFLSVLALPLKIILTRIKLKYNL